MSAYRECFVLKMLTLLGEGHQRVWRETVHAHTALQLLWVVGISLCWRQRHANSFFFPRQTHRESLLFAKCQNRYTFLNVMLFK